jgi:protein-disulfide isomerase
MSKTFLGIIIAVILVFIGIFALTGKSSSTSSGNIGTLTQHTEGLGEDHVTLVEYGDYQCPYCGEYFPIVKQVEAQYNKQITFQFRNFPLTSLHPNAFAAARAAEAAALQGKFWQMHDLLYEGNDEDLENSSANTWITASDPTPYFNAYAKSLDLNLTQFKADYASDKVNNLINADESEGTKLGVDGTPTFFLDGKKVSVGESVSEFETLIKNAIAQKAGKSTTTTTSAGTTAQTKSTSGSSTTK